MSAKITLGSTLASTILVVIIGIIVVTGNQANTENSIEVKEQSKQNNIDIQKINATINNFIESWFKRVDVSNKNNNESRALEARQTSNIIGNLTAHRIIANLSNANQTHILHAVLNATHALTSDEYNKAAEKKVENILGNMTKEHDVIFKALNITKTDNETDAETDIAKLKKAIQELENRTK